MGFTTGFTGGVTLTLGIAYLTVLTHERNRQFQAQQLRTQSRVLTSLLEPTPIPPPQTRAELAREERGTFIETAKDRWNEEIESAVRWVQRTDWNDVRENLGDAVSRLMGTPAGQRAQEEVGSIASAAKAKAQEAAASTREGGNQIAEAAKRQAEQVADNTREGAHKVSKASERLPERTSALAREKADAAAVKATELKDAAKAGAKRAQDETKTGAHEVAESIRSSGGTVDAARGAVRDAIGRGIEKGKEVLGKAQSAVGLAEQKVASAVTSDPVEKVLQERYEKPNGLEKSVEQTLAERYKPVDAQDHSHLRGV